MSNRNILRVAGIDPGMRNSGVAIAAYDLDSGDYQIDHVAIVQTQRQVTKTVRQNSDDYRCAREMIRGVDKILVAHGVKFVFAELPTGAQSARAMFAFGITTAIMAGLTPPLIQVTPNEVKLASAGHKTATKAEMMDWAMTKWPKLPWLTRKSKGAIVPVADNEHLADACACIPAGLETVEFAQALALAAGMRSAA